MSQKLLLLVFCLGLVLLNGCFQEVSEYDEIDAKEVKDWVLFCSHETGYSSDIYFDFEHPVDSKEINLVVAPWSEEIEITSIVGKGDFLGAASLTKEVGYNRVYGQSQIEIQHFLWEGIQNSKPMQKIENGVLEFTYLYEGKEKSFVSVCKAQKISSSN